MNLTRLSTLSIALCLALACVRSSASALASEQGSPQADTGGQYEAGRQAYEAGRFDLALPKLLPFAKQGNAEAEYMVGEMYAFGYSVLVPKNEKLGVYYIESSAQHGYWMAQDVIGVRYIQGRGVPADQCKAFRYFQSAANLNPVAGNELGNMYKDGLCVPQSCDLARQWYEKASQAGSKDARQNLINLRLQTCGDAKVRPELQQAAELVNRQDWTRALPLLLKLANQGVVEAQDQLGWSYLFGQGLKGDPGQAFFWLRKAASQDDAYAEAMVGVCYELGQGVSANEAAAFSWYQRSANRENGAGYFYLARAYEFGIGTRRNIEQARRYYYLAELQGNPRAEHYGNALANPNYQDARTEAQYRENLRKAQEEARRQLEYERTHPALHCISPMAVMTHTISQASWSALLWRQSGGCPLAPLP